MKRTVCTGGILAMFTAGIITVAHASDGKNLGKVTGGDFGTANAVIEKRCTACHGREKIDAALKSGKNLAKIQKDMEKRGARLDTKEREVLGIYWKQNPLKQK